jgi:putative phage-type endonuclease
MTDQIEQGSPEWFAARAGKVTASRIGDIMAKTKSGYGAGRKNYMADLVAERLTGTKAEGYTNAAMQWGIDTEPQAAAAYAFMNDADLATVGFVDHPFIEASGASPDRLVGDDGLVEIKCPNTATHIDTLLGSPIDRKYLLQMQWQMACTGRQWCDFASFDPRLPEELQLHVERVTRDDALITEIEGEVRAFLSELDAKVSALQARYMSEAA